MSTFAAVFFRQGLWKKSDGRISFRLSFSIPCVMQQEHLQGNPEWDGLPMPHRLWAIVAVALGVSVSVIDSSIANIALPMMAAEFQVSNADSIWIVNAYQLAMAVLILSFSTLGDTWGYRKVYVSGLILFTLASVVCTFSGSFLALVIGRILQGIGASAVTSINTTVIRTIYPRKKLGRGMGINATVVAVSSVLGPSLASAILSIGPWPWLFAVNIPIGVLALGMCYRFLPPNPVKIRERHFDWHDGLMAGAIFGILIFAIEGRSHGVSIMWSGLLTILSVVMGAVFVRHQLRKPYPILPFDLLSKPIFSVSMLTAICSYIAQMSALVALPFFFHDLLGKEVVRIGWLMMAWPAAIVCMAPLAGIWMERIHAAKMGGTGLAVMGVGLILLSRLESGIPEIWIVSELLICGFGFSLFQSPNNSILIASAPAQRSGSASGMLATARIFGQTIGSAVVAFMFTASGTQASRYALYVSAVAALAASVVSFARVSLPLPEALQNVRKDRRRPG